MLQHHEAPPARPVPASLALAACGGNDVQDAGGGSSAAPASTAPRTKLVVTVWADPSTSAAPTVTTVDGGAGRARRKNFAPTDPTARRAR